MPRPPTRLTVLAPVAAPYREPLFAGIDARDDIDLHVIYGAAAQPSWDVPDGYFARRHAYSAVHLQSRQLPRPGRTPVMFARGIAHALSASRPDVVVASEYGPSALRARLWAARHGVPHLLFSECTPAIDRLLGPVQLGLHRHFARHVDGAIVVSSRARERLLNFGVPAERISVALQSADLGVIRASAAEAPRSDSAPLRVLTVARLVPDKQVGLLIRTVAQAAADVAPRRVVLDVVGDGFLRAELEASARELGVAAAFHGHRSGAELAGLYARADVFALLSSYEPFGVVVREAAAAGLPLLVSDVVGAVGDVAIAGANAIVVPPGDLSAAATALTRLLDDPQLRTRMADASRAIDAATAGREVAAFAEAVAVVAARHRGEAAST